MKISESKKPRPREILAAKPGSKVPPGILNLLNDAALCGRVAKHYKDLERIIVEVIMGIPENTEKAETAGPTCLASAIILKHLRVFRDQGEHDERQNKTP